MKKVAFTGIAPPSKYDWNFIITALKKHHTTDPEEALMKENVPFDSITSNNYTKLSGMKRISSFYVEKDISKYAYLNEKDDKLIILVIDSRSTCFCQ